MAVPMSLGQRATERIHHGVVHGILILGSLVFLFPLFWMVSTSLKTVQEINLYPPVWIPDPPQWINYPTALTRLPFHLYFMNTMIIVVATVAGDLASCTLVAYGFSRLRFPGRDYLFMVLVSTMILPGFVRLVPVFIMFSKLGWVNTYLPLTVPSFFGSSAFLIFLVRQFFMTIPNELSDAARIDGSSEIGIWWRLMLPLSKPVLAVVSIFAFQGAWNDFLGPLIYLNDENMKTLALALWSMRNLPYEEQNFHHLMAANVVMVLPVIVIFTFFQRYFIEGVTLTGIKG